ncbi:MAG: hypothetical protein DHS20C15_12130 [Planctomycetota bacterium]|nr:MAG: hypothetical protein DHS20C15_12130 [Planctomycetota bacterium]
MLFATLLLALSPSALPAAGPAVTPPILALTDDAVFASARTKLRQGAADVAVSELNALLDATSDPDVKRQAADLLTDAYLALGDPIAALDMLEGVMDEQPAHVDFELANGRAFVAWTNQMIASGATQEDIDLTRLDALSSFENAAELSPAGDHRALIGEAYLYLYHFGDHAHALEMASAGLEASPDDAELLLLRGCAGVYETYNASVAGDTERADASWNTAVADLRAAAEGLPRERLEPWGQLAYLYESKGDGVQAVRAALEIADRQPEPDFDNLYRLAKKYSFERNWNASSLALQKMTALSAIELTRRVRAESELDMVATELSWSVGPFVQRNDRATALGILRALTRAETNAIDVWHNYAVLLDETGANADAKVAYEKRIELDPRNPRAYNDLASLLHRSMATGDNADEVRAEARELYAKCIELATEQLAEENLADARRNELTTARTLATNSLDEITPKSPERALGGLLDGLLEGLGEAADGASGEGAGGEGGAPAEGAGSAGETNS